MGSAGSFQGNSSAREGQNSSSTAPRAFVLLRENHFAHETVSLLGQAGEHAQSAFVYGPSGVGKSLLAATAVARFKREYPQANVWQVSASEFAAQFAEASSRQTIPKFQAETRNIEFLILEDLQALEGRHETQVQLLALTDHLAASLRPILWTSRKSPGELAAFSPRLVSRFRRAVLAGIQLPDGASRRLLLSQFAKTWQVNLSQEIQGIIAERLAVSPRELSAAVRCLGEFARNERRPISTDLVRNFLKYEAAPGRVRLEDICRVVARQFGISAAALRSSSRHRNLVLPRQCAMSLARELTSSNVSQIGRHFGRRDHSTVVHACQRLATLTERDAQVRSVLNQLRRALAQCAPSEESKS